jgi:anti-sigma regulatory factor (Ser/Thr protein kinase)
MVAGVDTDLASLSIRPDAEEIRRASEWLETIARENGVPAEQIYRLDLCLNEVLANIITHGGVAALAEPIVLTLRVSAGQAKLCVSDTGIAFDPLHAMLKPQAHTLAQATPGGLGLGMMKAYSDALEYRRQNERNCLTLVVCWQGSTG